jgi:hypothetical protein
MITYQDSELPITCPFCDSENVCAHLFALYNITFDTLEGGFLYDKIEIEEKLKKYFLAKIKNNGGLDTSSTFENKEINTIWEELLYQEGCQYIEETKEWEIDLPNINSFVFECLENLIIPEIGEFEGGPGASSLFKIYFTENTAELYSALLKEVDLCLAD